jgi:hypothetical protein
MNNPSFLKIAIRKRIVIDSIKVMLVVGTVLNAINQGNEIIYGLQVNWFKVLLTYAVPYLVSTYASVKTVIAVE